MMTAGVPTMTAGVPMMIGGGPETIIPTEGDLITVASSTTVETVAMATTMIGVATMTDTASVTTNPPTRGPTVSRKPKRWMAMQYKREVPLEEARVVRTLRQGPIVTTRPQIIAGPSWIKTGASLPSLKEEGEGTIGVAPTLTMDVGPIRGPNRIPGEIPLMVGVAK